MLGEWSFGFDIPGKLKFFNSCGHVPIHAIQQIEEIVWAHQISGLTNRCNNLGGSCGDVILITRGNTMDNMIYWGAFILILLAGSGALVH